MLTWPGMTVSVNIRFCIRTQVVLSVHVSCYIVLGLTEAGCVRVCCADTGCVLPFPQMVCCQVSGDCRRPDPVSAVPTLGSASNASTIVLEWEAPPPVLPDSPLLYLVDYTLNQNPSQQSPVIGVSPVTGTVGTTLL